MRIVIVDSEETSREVIKQAINTVVETHKIKSGCKIVGEAADGRKGCEIIVKERPDLIIMDLELPGKNGLPLLKKFKHVKCFSRNISYNIVPSTGKIHSKWKCDDHSNHDQEYLNKVSKCNTPKTTHDRINCYNDTYDQNGCFIIQIQHSRQNNGRCDKLSGCQSDQWNKHDQRCNDS